jgi:radical SAM protein with 4Fe4S-binding SPASM domain
MVKNAIIAITYHCNSRCLTCDIWKKKKSRELSPLLYNRLPSSLVDINITGGEPYLRSDLPLIIKTINKRCPKARIIINSNGLLMQKIIEVTKELMVIDPKIAIRISIDGQGLVHDKIRGVKGAFSKATQTLASLQKIPVKDLGISFTLIQQNENQLLSVYKLAKKNNWEFSLTVATDSQIYFGNKKKKLRPHTTKNLEKIFSQLEQSYYQNLKPKSWLRGWFADSLFQYLKINTRPFSCDAGENFFYLDPAGNIFTCHLKNWLLGNLQKQTFEKIWQSPTKIKYQNLIKKCNSCWMICTAKTSMTNNWLKISSTIFFNKLRFFLNHAA